MKFRSVFDVIGPVMVGPSSSHTAGAVRIGLIARRIFGKEPEKICITLYGSFKDTYKGHGTDIALIGGLLGYDTADKRIRTSLETAEEKGIDFKFIESDIEHIHPNTAKIEVEGAGNVLDLVGKSIGGGKMVLFELLGFDVHISGDFPTVFIFFNFSEKNKELVLENIKNIFMDKIVTEKFSNSVIEGKGLLTVELLELIDESTMEKITILDCVKEVKIADRL